MRIAIFGFYNAMNIGDDRIMYSWTRLLEGHLCTFFRHCDPPCLSTLRAFDLILIGGGGLVWNHVGVWKDVLRWTRKCSVPIGVAGLGVNEVSEDLKSELAELIKRASFFYVRDSKSHELLNRATNVQVMPDLSWLYPFAQRRDVPKHTTALNLCHRIGVSSWKVKSILHGIDLSPFPLHMAAGEDVDYLKEVVQGVVSREWNLYSLASAQLALLCRYHAVQFAVQLGLPFLAVIYDDKVTRFLNDHKLSDLAILPGEFDSVPERLDWLKRNIVPLTERIGNVRAKLTADGLALSGSLVGQIESISKQRPTTGLRLRRRFDRLCSRW